MNSNQVVIKVIGNYSYNTSRCLGQGVYGKVYQGTQKQTKQKVAIKKIDLATFTNDKYLQNAIFSQIYLLKRFNHPNIVKFKDVLSSKNSLYIITEFCKNGDLKEVLKKKRFKEEDAFEIMKQILSGFTELVRERIVHRDLKPANILINQGVYKIGDFGFAKYVDNFGTQMLKSCVGSPIYMAPQILERTPYTTKCDIWSIGVIFYQMIHNSPPWKAKDQNELLRAIKNISISHILRKSSLSPKAIQFLKRTLAFSQEQRIGWAQLFQMYGPRSDKHHESMQKNKDKAATKQKQRVVSANSGSHLSTQYSNPTSKLTPLTPINTSTNSINSLNSLTSLVTLNSPTLSPERKRNLFPPSSQNHSNSNTRSQSAQQKKPNNQIQNVIKWRQFLIFYHYNCVQSFITYPTIITLTPKPEPYLKFLLCLSLLIKNRSTFCLSMIAIHSRNHKNAEQLYKTMKSEHESYEMVYNDLVVALEKQGFYKSLKAELTAAVGHGEVINEERMEKMEAYMLESAVENVRNIVDMIKQKERDRKNSMGNTPTPPVFNLTSSPNKQSIQTAQTLDNLLQLILFSSNRQKHKTVEQILEQHPHPTPEHPNTGTPSNGITHNNNSNSNQRLKYEYNSEGNINVNGRVERKMSEEIAREGGRDWGDGFLRDFYGMQVVGKYERVMGALGEGRDSRDGRDGRDGRGSNGNTGSIGNINL